MITLEFLNYAKKNTPEQFRKIIPHKIYPEDFEVVYDKMKYREDMVKLRKQLLEDLYKPENNFTFHPKITPYEVQK